MDSCVGGDKIIRSAIIHEIEKVDQVKEKIIWWTDVIDSAFVRELAKPIHKSLEERFVPCISEEVETSELITKYTID